MAPIHGQQQADEKRPDSAVELDDEYVLTRDVAATARLNLSHYIWLASFGFNLHPRITQDLEGRTGVRVADIGTGTGIWLLDVANQLPKSAQLEAIDISFNQCPPREWLPKNVSLRLVDVFREVPDDLIEKYDVIHIRHFVCVVKANDPRDLLRNLLRMLKPGGWLQWDEWDVTNRRLTKTQSDGPQSNIDKLEEAFAVMRRHTPRPDWPPRLDDYLLAENLQRVAIEKRNSSHAHLPYMHDLTLLVFQELIDMAESKSSMNAEQTRHLRHLLGRATRESRQGAAWNLTRCMAIGRKELE